MESDNFPPFVSFFLENAFAFVSSSVWYVALIQFQNDMSSWYEIIVVPANFVRFYCVTYMHIIFNTVWYGMHNEKEKWLAIKFNCRKYQFIYRTSWRARAFCVNCHHFNLLTRKHHRPFRWIQTNEIPFGIIMMIKFENRKIITIPNKWYVLE